MLSAKPTGFLASSVTTLKYSTKRAFDRGVVALNNDFGVVPVERFLGEDNDRPIDIKATGHQLVLQHKISDSITLSASYAYTDAYTSNNVINADWGVEIPAGSRLISVAKNSRAFASMHISEQIRLMFDIDNLFDEDY